MKSIAKRNAMLRKEILLKTHQKENSKPHKTLQWVKANEAYSSDLLDFVSSNFKKQKFNTLEIVNRQLTEGIATGFSRPEQNHNGFKFHLNDFANVMRGIATGSNEFFFLTSEQVKELGIPKEFLKRAVGRTKDAPAGVLTLKDVEALENENRPTFLLSINGQLEIFREPEAHNFSYKKKTGSQPSNVKK